MSAFPASSIHCREIARKKVSKCQKSTLLKIEIKIARDLIRSVDNRFSMKKWKNWLHRKFLRMSYIGFPATSPWIYNFTLFPLGHLIAEPVGSSLASCRWVMFLNQPASRDTRPNFAFALQLTQTQIHKKCVKIYKCKLHLKCIEVHVEVNVFAASMETCTSENLEPVLVVVSIPP